MSDTTKISSTMPVSPTRWLVLRANVAQPASHCASSYWQPSCTLPQVSSLPSTIIATMAKIGAGVLERFYYAYAEYCASPLVFKHSVHPPKNQQELTEVLYKSKMMGTPGIITWMDGATYDWLACPAALKNLRRDKSGNTSVMFNISADTTCIQHVYGPDYGGRNDKTAARMDNWALAIHNGLVFDGIDYASFSMASIMERSPTSCTIRQAH